MYIALTLLLQFVSLALDSGCFLLFRVPGRPGPVLQRQLHPVVGGSHPVPLVRGLRLLHEVQ